MTVPNRRACLALLVPTVLAWATGGGSASAGTLRVAAYNVNLDTGTTSPSSSISQVLEDVGKESTYAPSHALDVIGLEETTSNATSVAPIVTSLNAYYGAGTYNMSGYQATQSGGTGTGNGPNALVYNQKTLNLLASVGVGTPAGSTNGEYRQVVRYEFQPVAGTAAQDFYVYVLHSKSGSAGTTDSGGTDGQFRSQEASIVTADAATLGANASVIVAGDLNIDGTVESSGNQATNAYQKYVAAGLVDPLNPTDASQTYNGSNKQFSSILTESTQKSFSYRDDLQFQSANVFNGSSAALDYVGGTEHAFGNNGSVSAGGTFATSSTSPYEAELYAATDHLPIVADYSFVAAPEPTTLLTAGLAVVALVAPRRRRRQPV